MEVTLQTEVEAGASGFSVTGGGTEGIFIKKVLKESPASKIFSLREGDQLLSATIFFDDIKYEDALKILQYSEPYKVQFNLKRKIAGKEELEHIHATAQYKKERINQEKELSESIPEETLHISGKAISEEDRETLIASQRVGRSKRPKKDRLSWPKFQSIKNKKILGHRRSHSTSDAYEPAIQDVSPTSTDTESQFQQEVHIKEKKGSQKKLKFPSIGFKMHRSKLETQDKQKKEIKTTLLSEREKIRKEDISLENPEILTVEYTTSPAYEIKTEEVRETLTKDLEDTKNGIPFHEKKCPEVEISIQKEKDKESTSKFAVPEVPAVTQISKPTLETSDVKESPTKQTSQASSKSRKKKQKGTADKTEGASGINVDKMGLTATGSIQVKGLEIGTAKAELHTTSDTLETGEKQVEDDTQILTIQKTKFGISMPKRKEPETEKNKPGTDVPHSVPEKTDDISFGDSKNLDVKPHIPDTESEVSSWKIQMPSFKMTKTPKAEIKIPREESTAELGDTVKKSEKEEDGMTTSDKTLKMDVVMKTGEKDIEGKESKFRLPKFKLPTFTWASTKDETGHAESQVTGRDGKVPPREEGEKTEVSVSAEDIQIQSTETEIRISKGKVDDKDITKLSGLHLPSLKTQTTKTSAADKTLEKTEGEILITKTDIEIKKGEFSKSPKKTEKISKTITVVEEAMGLHLKAEVPGAKTEGATWKVEKPSLKMPKADIKAPKVDVSLPSVDVTLPSVDVTLPKASVDLQAPEAALALEGEAKAPEKEAAKTKDGKFKMPKFGMPSFGWSSSREAKGTVAADVDDSLKEPQVVVPSGTTEVDMTLPAAEIQEPALEFEKDDDIGKARSSLFRMPKVSLSISSKPQAQKKSNVEVSLSETSCYSVTEESPVVLSGSVGSKPFPYSKADSGSKSSKFRIPSLGFSKVDIGSSKIEQDSPLPKGDITLTKYQMNLAESKSKVSSLADENLSVTDFEILKEDDSSEQGIFKPGGKTPTAEIPVVDSEFIVKIPKFRKPKFGISWSKGKQSESDVGSKVESEISKGRIISDTTDTDIEKPTHISDAELGVKMHKPSPDIVLDAPKLDVSLPSMEVTMPKSEVEIHGPDLECKAEQELVSGEKDTEEKENRLKTSKFKFPSFSWSPKKESIIPPEVEGYLAEPTSSTLSGDTESELTFPTPDNQYLHAELDTSTEKDGEKGRNKKSQFVMPKISFPKMKGQKAQVCLPILETEVCGPKQEKEAISVQKSEKGSDGKGSGIGIKGPNITVPTLEFSKPEVKAPQIEMDISMPTGETILPTREEDDLTLKSADGNASLSTSDIKMATEVSLEVKSPDTSVERTSSEIAVGDVEIKIEGPEGKTKMSKFQMPKFGITHSKGKGSEKEVGQSKSEVKVPQLKATVEIADIAVEAPNLEVECGTETETYSPKVKMTKADNKASEADVHLPSADTSISKTDSDIRDSDAALKFKGEIKQDGDEEEKEGHFKLPKFKLPSFSWSPKKEASVKSDSGANLEDHKPAVTSGRIDTEVRGTVPDDQATGPALDLDIFAGNVEQKSPIKKPQLVMPKISLSKIKVPKSQTHSPKVESDATIPKTEEEGDDLVQIPDIERSHSKRTEGAQISIKLADVKIPTLELSRIETGASQTRMGVSSAKTGAALPPSEESFQQVVLKSSSTDEDTIQKTGIKFPKGEASIELRSPEIVTERSSVVDGRKMKLEGPEGKIKMPKFQKPRFGISLTKGKGSETEISAPKIEAELPQLKMTHKIADVAVEVPASELTSDVSDPGVGAYACKMKTPQVLTAGIEAPEVDISPQTSLKGKKGDADVERSMEKGEAGIPSAKVQTETSSPENTFSLPHAVAEITIGKEGIPKLGDSVKSSEVSLPKMGGDISLSTERTDSRVNIPKTETYADIVKHSAEGQKMHTSEFTVSSAELSKSYLSASEIDKDNSLTNRFPTHTLTLEEYQVKSQDTEVPKVESSTKLETSGAGCKPSSAEITLDATQEKTDTNIPKEELDVQNQEAVIKKGKIKGEMRIIEKDSEGSQLERPMCEWSTTKGSEDGVYVTAKLEDLKVEVPTVKMGVKIARVDPDTKFQVKSVEKDTCAVAEVQVEDRAETSKIKTYKFEIPKFGVLHSEVKGFEDDINLPNLEAASVSKTEIGTAETPFEKSEGSISLESPALDHMGASTRITVETVEKSQVVPEVHIKIPKLKIPRFTFKSLPTEADVSVSRVVTDPKGSSTDIEVVQLQASSTVPEETPEALQGGLQKAKSKILTLTEPDIKTAQMTTTVESSLSSAGQDIHWSYVEGQEVSEKVEPEHVAIERCEIYATEILKESEILSSEVKTAALGFSLLKVKLPESHSNLEVLVQQSPSTEDVSVSKPKCADESFGVAAQRTGRSELKLSDKPHSKTEECCGEVSLPKLKTFAVEVKPSDKPEESQPDKSPEVVTAGPLSKDEDVSEALEDEEKDISNEKEKTDSKRSPGRFKFWLPSIGFSSSGDETSTDSKTEVKKSVSEDVKPADLSDNDSSKQTEKTGWFRFPKLGFTSPSKKAKTADKEGAGHKERGISDEDSPSDKPDVFFDAQESFSPKETTEVGKVEIDEASSNVPVSRTIVTSSARTELILLEEEKDSQSNIPGDTTK
ncbi:PREDICTED: protein AHNAK2-like [Tauraco erythrolophus]|uniref:protein AHNAK2-like n=1 Tax=Tauraco erythrolophus TaxID=121530 RepID=UPI0005239126|nr:PREDICTED: protein AHNAK2-like [Tauraco erythrolophus]